MNCNNLDVELLKIVSILKTLITILQIVVMVALIIWIMIDVIKMISSGDVDNSKLLKTVFKRLIAGALVLLVPAIVVTVINLFAPGESQYDTYYKCANDETVERVSIYQATEAIDNFQKNPDLVNYRKAKDAVSIVGGSKRTELDKQLKDLYKKYFPYDDEENIDWDGLGTETTNYAGVIYIGDSNMDRYCDHINATYCFALVGAGTDKISYFKTQVDSFLSQHNSRYKIFIMLGTNSTSTAKRYFEELNSYAKGDWNKHQIIVGYIPAVSDSILESGKYTIRNSNVQSFNNQLQSAYNNNHSNNIRLCSRVYDKTKFMTNSTARDFTDDGLHLSNKGLDELKIAINSCIN